MLSHNDVSAPGCVCAVSVFLCFTRGFVHKVLLVHSVQELLVPKCKFVHTGVFAHKDFLHTRLCSCKRVNSFRAQFVCTQRYVCEQRCIFFRSHMCL